MISCLIFKIEKEKEEEEDTKLSWYRRKEWIWEQLEKMIKCDQNTMYKGLKRNNIFFCKKKNLKNKINMQKAKPNLSHKDPWI